MASDGHDGPSDSLEQRLRKQRTAMVENLPDEERDYLEGRRGPPSSRATQNLVVRVHDELWTVVFALASEIDQLKQRGDAGGG